MSKRKYTHIKGLEELVISMRGSGMTRQEIADELGLDKIQVKKQGIWRAICEKSYAALRLFRLVEAPAPIPKHAEFFCGHAPTRC